MFWVAFFSYSFVVQNVANRDIKWLLIYIEFTGSVSGIEKAFPGRFKEHIRWAGYLEGPLITGISFRRRNFLTTCIIILSHRCLLRLTKHRTFFTSLHSCRIEIQFTTLLGSRYLVSSYSSSHSLSYILLDVSYCQATLHGLNLGGIPEFVGAIKSCSSRY